jgi:stage II sporulation protein D
MGISLQKPYYFCNILIIVIALVATGCARRSPRQSPRPVDVPARTTKERTAVPSRVPNLKPPLIRIGLKTDSRAITFSADEKIYFTDGSRSGVKDSPLIAGLSFVSTVPTQFFVQIGSFSTREAAETARGQMKSRQASRIFESVDMRRYQLQLGPLPSQERAQQVVEQMKSEGYPGAFYISESPESQRLPDLVLRDELGEVLLRTTEPIFLWTSKQILSADAAPYRGYLSVRVNRSARLTLVNVLNFEDYLKGVVPNEIGPASNSVFEALKAQAVAARTYAIKNMNQFDHEGYDICSTPRCQVYSGYKTEHFLTSQAVEETAGEVIQHNHEPINALYTSTCGGRTEHAEYMFEGWDYPYLKSVECYPEEEKVSTGSIPVRGREEEWHEAWVNLKTGIAVDQNGETRASKTEIEASMPVLLDSLGKTACSAAPLATTSWADVSSFLVSNLCWEKKRDSLLDNKDYQYFVNRLQLPAASTPDVQSFLFLFHEGIVQLPEQKKTFDPYAPVKRKEFRQAVFNILKHYHQVNSSDGIVREISRNQIQVVDDLGVHSYELRPSMYLYQRLGDRITARNQVNCAPGDKIEYVLNDQQIGLLVCEVDPAGVAVDRSSKVTFWKETITPSELGKKVARYLDIGDILELQPVSYGASNRIFELKLTGTRGSGTLRGIRVRWALGLRDNWFTIERTFERNGKVKQFIFTGRGWGHGVGMCQVGAIGFAKQGKDYKFILQHYYTGVQIKKTY